MRDSGEGRRSSEIGVRKTGGLKWSGGGSEKWFRGSCGGVGRAGEELGRSGGDMVGKEEGKEGLGWVGRYSDCINVKR